jgi:catechol 2,3-dioxygenase-like lactoylglutathione lyase family enzyme
MNLEEVPMAERNPYIPAHVPDSSIRVSCIQHANVSTSNVKRSQEWYKKVFDAEWTEEHPRYLKLGSSELHIAEREEVNAHERNHFAVEVENWEAWLTNLARVGVPFDREPRENDGKLSGFICDPDGNRIEVMWHADWHKIY